MEIIREKEGAPASYPDTPSGLSTAAAAIAPAVVWARIERFIYKRYTERTVEWIVDGCGAFEPPLEPTIITATERWSTTAQAWEPVALDLSAFGYALDGDQYRFVGTVGGGAPAVPEIVDEAYRLYAEYYASMKKQTAVGVRSESVPDVYTGEFREGAWRARAFFDSGAAEALRSLKRV